jgi:hypothetical protein
MFVLDVRGLSQEQLGILEAAYDELSKEPLAPLAQLASDPVRQKIDEAISDVLRLPSFRPVRELLAREPGLTGHEINPKATLESNRAAEDERSDHPQEFPFEEHSTD